MRGLILLLLAFTGLAQVAEAQTAGDFRSAQTGDWNNAGTWETFNGTIWVAAVATPTSASGEITILSTHVVTIPSGFSVTADQLIVNEDLVIAAGGQLTLANGTGTDLSAITAASSVTISGILIRGDLSTIDNQSNNTRIFFNSGGEYRHNYTTTFGDLPISTWNANATVTVQGFTNTTEIIADNTWAQSLGHFVFNAPGQRGVVNFAGNLTTVQGNLSIVSTGTNVVQFSSVENPTITIGGNLSVSGTSRFNLATDGTATVLNIGGNFSFTSTNTTGSNLTVTGTSTVNLTGDMIINCATGRLHLVGGGSTTVANLNLNGNFTLTSGRIDELGATTSQANLNFIGVGNRTFTNTGTITGYINYNISAATILDLGTSPAAGVAPSAFVLNGTIIVRSLDGLGAIANSTVQGNIRTPVANRSYISGSTIIYQGAALQFMSAGQPQTAGVTTIVNNASGVRLSGSPVINGSLQLQTGNLELNNFSLTIGESFTANVGSYLRGTTASTLVVSGTNGGSIGTLQFDPTASSLGTLTINRTGSNASVTLNSASALTVNTALNLINGELINTSGITLADNALLTRYSTSTISGNAPVAATAYNVTYTTASPTAGPYADFDTGMELPTTATGLRNLTIATLRNGDFVNLASDITINGNVNLGRGTLRGGAFTITMNGSTWSDNSGNFTAGTGAVNFNGTTTVGGSSNPTFNHIGLTTGNSLTFTRSFSLSGDVNFASGSTFNMGAFTTTLTGTAVQTIAGGGATFYNITVSKTGGSTTLTSEVGLSNILQFTTTNNIVASNGFLTLLSSSDAAAAGATGIIYRLGNGNNVTGNVTAQRYMSGEGRIYRYISSPVSGAMVSQWKDDFDITGPFQDPTPARLVCGVRTNSTSYSLFYYNEAVAGDIQQGYVGYPITGNATTNSPIVVGRGYAAHIRECDNPTIIDVTGPINAGNYNLPITYTVNTPAADGWNLVGNPYPCNIDWDLSWTKTRISPIISITDNGSGMIRYYESGVTNDIPNGIIAPGQGFFVRATGANPLLTIRENSKVLTTAEFYKERTASSIPVLALNFSDGKEYDRAYLKIQEGAQNGLDDFDAPKITNPIFSFSILSDEGQRMAINAIDQLAVSKTYQLAMEDAAIGDYSIALEIGGNHFSNYHFVLHDHYLHKDVVMKRNEGYSFSVLGDSRSGDVHRFSFSVVEGIEAEESSAHSVVAYPNPIQDKLTIDVLTDDVIKLEFTNLQGQVQSTIDVKGRTGNFNFDFNKYAKGVYLMTVYKQNSKKSIRLFKE